MKNRLVAFAVVGAILAIGMPGFAQWRNFGRDPQHTGLEPVPSQSLNSIHWQTPVDLRPQYDGNDLLIHYGTPLVTAANTVMFPVKTGIDGRFRMEARNGATGNLVWSLDTDYALPPHNWTPEVGATLTSAPRVYYPGVAGTVYYRDTPDAATGAQGQLAFYGLSQYTANLRSRIAFTQNLRINTPITSDAAGNIYFGFWVMPGGTPLFDSSGRQLSSGIARISATGEGNWTPVTTAANDSNMIQPVMNCAPAITADGGTLYIAVRGSNSAGYLVALNSSTLAPIASVRLKDPKSNLDAQLNDSGTASPMIAPDGDVYYGVLENGSNNHNRGYMLHFNASLSLTKTPGAFGWDDTASVVPTTMVPSYTGTSPYLLMTKYNDYATEQHKLAILDPFDTQVNSANGAIVMKEILTVLGPTPNGSGVTEWCINSAAIDPATNSVLAGSEDGKFYRWDLTTNTLTQTITLTPGIGEAYTPSVVAVDGTVYAINNGTLFALGQ
jgi:hypothetical protein